MSGIPNKMLPVAVEMLPEGYRRLEYLETTGEQWIDTEITEYFSLTQTISAVAGQKAVVGLVHGTGITINYWGVHETGQFYLGGAGSLGFYVNEPTSITYELTHEFVNVGQTGGHMQKKEVTASKPSQLILGFTANPINCFRLHSAQISVNDALVRDFIPSLDPTGRPCMFDTVSRKPFYNTGTGEFVYRLPGDGELPAGYTRLEYLESTGTQYIDTGIKLSNESEVKCEYETDYTPPVEYLSLFGCRNSDNTTRFACYVAYPEGKIQNVAVYVGGADADAYWPREYGKCVLVVNGEFATYNGNRKNYTAVEVFETETACRLFRGVGDSYVGRVYSFSISRDDQLQLNLIPCLDDKGVPCMFDTVTRRPFRNAATTGPDFLYG